MCHDLFILSIPERPPSEQSLFHFPSGNIPLWEASDLAEWLFSLWGKEMKTYMSPKDLAPLMCDIIQNQRDYLLFTLKPLALLRQKIMVYPHSHIPALILLRALRKCLRLNKVEVCRFYKHMYAGSPCSDLFSSRVCMHHPDTKTGSETVELS